MLGVFSWGDPQLPQGSLQEAEVDSPTPDILVTISLAG